MTVSSWLKDGLKNIAICTFLFGIIFSCGVLYNKVNNNFISISKKVDNEVVNEKFDRILDKIDNINIKIDNVDKRMAKGFNDLNNKYDRLDVKMTNMQKDIHNIDTRVCLLESEN